MMQIVRIGNSEVLVKEYRGQRVVTFKDIDTVHERIPGTASRNFRENRDRFIKDVDYFEVTPDEFQPDEIRRFGIDSPRGGLLITESGYLMLVKSLNDDLAWTVQRELVNNYFRLKPQLSPLEILQGTINELVKQEQRLKQLEEQQKVLDNKVVDIQRGLVDINAPLRTQFVDIVRKIAVKKGEPFDKVFNEIYLILGKQEHIDIEKRARNRKVSKIDIVEQENLLVKAIRLAKTLHPDIA